MKIFMLAVFAPPRHSRFRWCFVLKYLHIGFFIAADHQVVLRVSLKGITNALRLGIKFFVMAVDPVLTLVRLSDSSFIHKLTDA